MRALAALVAVATLVLASAIGARWGSVRFVLGVVLPFVALCVWVGGLVWRVVWWAKSPVPFRIPTTCGQQRSCDFLPANPVDNPQSSLAVGARLASEILLFRSLFRNNTAEVHSGPRLVFAANRWLWLGSLLFHYSLLVVLLRHLRLFMAPVPGVVAALTRLDSGLELGLPPVTLTSVMLTSALVGLLLRRLGSARLRYVSLVGDYWALLLLLAIAGTGLLLRHWARTDVTAIKDFCLSVARLEPVLPERIHWLFFTHLFLVSVLLVYFPFGKLVHMGGALLSPTRNLANDSRRKRHVNPWAQPAKLHPYAAYEDMFRDKMLKAGIPVEKSTLPPTPAEASSAAAKA